MNRFFITGLPRMRSCWLANLLTNGDSFCFHAGLLTVGANLEELPKLLDSRPETHVGDADPPLLSEQFFERTVQLFPDAKWVFVVRPVRDALEAHNRAFPEIPATLEEFEDMTARIVIGTRKTKGLLVDFADLADFETCDRIHRFVTGRPAESGRWIMLSKMNIQADRAAWIRSFSPETLARVEAVAGPL